MYLAEADINFFVVCFTLIKPMLRCNARAALQLSYSKKWDPLSYKFLLFIRFFERGTFGFQSTVKYWVGIK